MTLKKHHLYPTLIFIAFFLVSTYPNTNPDYWWHLKVGQHIIQTHSIPKIDIFSHTLPSYPYVYHSWLTDILYYLPFNSLGILSSTLIHSLFYAATFAFITYKHRHLNLFYTLFLLPLIPATQLITGFRPQVVSLFFLVILYSLLSKNPPTKISSKTGFFSWLKKTNLYTLPLLFLLWVNLHGGFIFGLLLLATWLLIQFFTSSTLKTPPTKYFKYFFYLFLLILLTTLINPYHLNTYHLVYQMATNIFIVDHNPDWSSIITHPNPSQTTAYLIISALYFLYITNKNHPTHTKILMILFFILSLATSRYFLILTAIILYHTPQIIASLHSSFPSKPTNLLLYFFLTLSLLFTTKHTLTHIQATRFAYTNPQHYATLPSSFAPYPYQAIQHIQQHPIKPNILNEFTWGGYLIWHLPQYKYFIDGRMDNFFIDGQSFAQTYLELVTLKNPNWQQTLIDYQINTILLPPNFPLAQTLSQDPNWETTYQDQSSILLQKL